MKVEDIMCETLLISYKDLERMCKRVDAFILNYGNQLASIFNVFDKMTDLINEKIAYCNIKVLIEEAFAVTEKNIELQYKYLLGYKNEDIIKKFELSERTFFRKIKKQKEQIFCEIKKRHSNKQLFDLISSSKELTMQFDYLIEQELKKEKELDDDI